MHIHTTYFTFSMANHGTVERVLTETDAHGPFVGFIHSFSVGDFPIFADVDRAKTSERSRALFQQWQPETVLRTKSVQR